MANEFSAMINRFDCFHKRQGNVSIDAIESYSRIAIPFGPNAVAAADPSLYRPFSLVRFDSIFKCVQSIQSIISF